MTFTPRLTKLRDGLEIPTVGLGTLQVTDKNALKAIVKDSIKVGYRHIDTASVYNNEDMIGEVLQEIFSDESFGVKRGDIWITRTKGLDPQDPQNKANRIENWRALEDLQEKKLIRTIGVSNYQIRHLSELKDYARVLPTVNQCEFHPLLFTKDLVEYSQSLGIAFQAYSSLGEGSLVDGSHKLPVLDEIASNHGASIAQILLSWGMQHGAIILPKSSSKKRLIENFESQKITLTEKEMAAINDISSTQTKRFIWDSNTIL
ncbi:putative oxidoreductase YtbE [Smittium culicis]|uniref:Putative oxidoreductase YtbE n=1 Tax=Smittium culicis TaxID=133412 RepID=A0A1R1XCS0_9FUNG|nr:putative oxidoreductase YtbE [Smittium culicis]